MLSLAWELVEVLFIFPRNRKQGHRVRMTMGGGTGWLKGCLGQWERLGTDTGNVLGSLGSEQRHLQGVAEEHVLIMSTWSLLFNSSAT